MGHTSELNAFLNVHKDQLQSSGVPEHYWHPLYQKLVNQIFDAGELFQILKLENEDRKDHEPLWALQALKDVERGDPNHVYLIDHAWTFKPEYAKQHLVQHNGLRQRMKNLFDLDDSLSKEELAHEIFENIWKVANHYSISNAEDVENRLPVWYIMDEVGCSVMHNDTPNCRIVPFVYIDDQITYSLLFPIEDIKAGEFLYKDYAEGITDPLRRSAILLPWQPKSFEEIPTTPSIPGEDYFLQGHFKETLPKTITNITKKNKYKVFTEYDLIKAYLTDSRFEIVDNEDDADILWYIKHFKDFEMLSVDCPEKYVNQFPFEYVVTVKDLLCITCRRSRDALQWLPTTYNLITELPNFVSYYQRKQAQGLDNVWIIKPYNLARGLDIHITDNLNYILKLSTTGPKIGQEYITRPVLFYRADLGGKVKFDVRYILLLKSVEPLQAYLYRKFFLRFANKLFELNEFEDYEKHFTVMNYKEEATLKHIKCEEFLLKWQEQQSGNSWESIEQKIVQMLSDILRVATRTEVPCGIAENAQSRAVYAVDLMLEYSADGIRPKILEINFTPDCKRACDYYPDFYNDIFRLLFLDETCELFLLLNA